MAAMTGLNWCLLVSIVSLGLLVNVPAIKADVSISVTNISNNSQPFSSYSVVDFFKNRYANTNSTMLGYLHQPQNRNSCSPDILPVPNDTSLYPWIALIEDYPICEEDMVKFVRNAGYSLILASSPNNSNFHLTKETSNRGFPIVLIKDDYMQYLITQAQSDFDDPQIVATVSANMIAFMLICLFVFGFVLLPTCCMCCLCCLWCLARRRRRRYEHEIRNLQQQRRNYNRAQNRDNMARQELIESILRQLQQLQLDSQTQQPLGAERTRQLPTKKYRKSADDSDSQEACAICVDDFKNGDNMRVLPCNHHFHKKCIDEWLINHSDLCPLCKKQVDRGNVQVQGARGSGRGGGGARAHDLVMLTDDDSIGSDYSLEQPHPPERPQERLIAAPGVNVRLGRGYGSV